MLLQPQYIFILIPSKKLKNGFELPVYGLALLFLEKQERVIFGFFEEIFEIQRMAENKLMIFMQSLKAALASIAQKLSYAEKVITLNNPERQLGLGYSLVYSQGKIIRSTKDVSLGQELELQVSDGRINSEVKKIIK